MKSTKQSTVALPLTAVKFLYKSRRSRKVVCEIDFSALKEFNEPNTIDELVAEARLERVLGKTKSFRSARELVRDLNA